MFLSYALDKNGKLILVLDSEVLGYNLSGIILLNKSGTAITGINSSKKEFTYNDSTG